MEIPQSRITIHGKAVDKLAEAARDYITALVTVGAKAQGIDTSNIKALRDYTVSALRDTYEAFGDQAATYAAITYDQYMSAYPNMTLDPATNEFDYDLSFLESKVTYQINRLDKDGLNKFAQAMGDTAYNFTRRCVNQTIIKNANRDFDKGVRYARVPTGLSTCGFCVMLASRGFAYKTKESAGYNPFGFNRFHNRCDCRVVPGTEETKIEGYDPERLRDVYSKARETIYDDAKRRWNELTDAQKKAYGSYSKWMTNNVINEINTRSPEWVYRGEKARISYESKEIEQRIKDHEKKTAERLSFIGIESVFINDQKHLGANTQGYADMFGGLEIKTLTNASSYNTIDGYIKNASRKKNCKKIVFDNTDNNYLDDDSLAAFILKSRRFERGSIYILNGEKYLKIR